MKTSTTKQGTDCKKFLHVSMFSLLTLLLCTNLYAKTTHRKPASAVPDEEVLTAPYEQKVLMQQIFAEDDAGVMRGIRNSLESYQQTEDYAKLWNLQSTGLYNTPSLEQKKYMITSNVLTYADKRLAGEIRNAEEGSGLQSIGKAEKALRPNAEVGISKSVSVKFKARVLQGKILMEVKNPVVEFESSVNARGKLHVISKKEFRSIGFTAGAEFRVSEGESVIFADQALTQNIKARVSSNQVNHQKAFSNDADKRLEMMAYFPFNL
jgi:hypothetical protein